ncbi:Putative dihydroxyacetone kinase, ADP-binding subunit [Mucinivorans hirudinis]|uniref:Putative dihydroxyacetone kinase, ADP-binding subunit n=1 Tax=Mucinivorans hirudinis TaxID=1433126 RepID=A0A060R8T2_9BACT|nr:Putative dihydroxyacetone kinase, ADP-binding subunit [Mucinivorans hirudinis]
MEKITIADFQRMIGAAYTNIKSRAEEFSKLDAALGDGDHGEAIETAFKVIARASEKGGNFKGLLGDMGFAVMLETSGSTSTLLGGFLLGMSDNVPAAEEIDADELKKMFAGGLLGVQKNTKAAIGDKTMMDALIPAVEAIETCQSNDINEVLRVGADAALKGVEATVNMKANFGRARNLGDKTIGHPDAGATSWASMFESFAGAL